MQFTWIWAKISRDQNFFKQNYFEVKSVAKKIEKRKKKNTICCLTCNCVNILLDPVICWFNFMKCPINRRNSFRFIFSNSDGGKKRSKPNSRLNEKEQKINCESNVVKENISISTSRSQSQKLFHLSLRWLNRRRMPVFQFPDAPSTCRTYLFSILIFPP